MKVLCIFGVFPPFNSAGSIRLGKLAEFLIKKGHEIQVVAIKNPPQPPTLPMDIDPNVLHKTPWINMNAIPETLMGGKSKVQQKGYSSRSGLIKRLGYYYRCWFNFPDPYIGWFPFGLFKAISIARKWRPDIIVCSSPPQTSIFIAIIVAKLFSIPWVTDFRDVWVDYVIYEFGPVRRKIETFLERVLLNQCNGFISISQPKVDLLKEKFPKIPAQVAMNGYSPEYILATPQKMDFDPKVLNIGYTGAFYPAIHEGDKFIKSLELAIQQGVKLCVHTYGRYPNLKDLAETHGMGQYFIHHGLISHDESLSAQISVDVLLLFVPTDEGWIPIKSFEYFISNTPIIATGSKEHLIGGIVNSRGFGFISEDPQDLGNYLVDRYHEKTQTGMVKKNTSSSLVGLSRDEQYHFFEELLFKVIGKVEVLSPNNLLQN